MSKTILLRLTGSLAVLLLTVVSCSRSPHDSDEMYYLVTANKKVAYWQEARAGFEEAARQLKVRAEFVGPDTYDPEAQQEEFHKIVQKKPTGILLSAADPKLMKPEIDAAAAAGINVITLDADVPDSKRLLFIGTNNYEAGKLGGEVLAKALGGKGNVVVFTMPGQANLRERLNGYRSVLEAHPGIKIVEVVDIQGSPTMAFDRTKQILDKSKDEVQAFVCLEALAGKEVAEVIDRHEARGKVVVAMDADEGTLDWIERGGIVATIAQKPYSMGFNGLKMLDQLYHKQAGPAGEGARAELPQFVDTGTMLVDKSNLDAFRKSLAGSAGK